MLGPYGVVAALVEALTDRLPARVGLVRAATEVTGLPEVLQVLGHEPDSVGVEGWPLVVVTAVSDKDWTPMERDTGTLAAGWLIRYQVRLTTWVRGDGYGETTTHQQLLHQAVVEALLTDLDVADGVRLDDTSLASSMSDIATTDAGRTIAGARLDLAVLVEERLTVATPPETVGELTTPTVGMLPRNAPAPEDLL